VRAEDGMLVCPACGVSVHTHVDEVLVRNAAGHFVEVSATGEDDGARLSTYSGAAGKPYRGRRHTVMLAVSCEECGGMSWLSFEQHKGSTLLEVST
jgi:uncharacterized Zn finger protein (UPF0148 family)